jgi:hypothetical protein
LYNILYMLYILCTVIGTDSEKLENLHRIVVEEEKIRIDSYSRKPFVVSRLVYIPTLVLYVAYIDYI